MIRLVCNKFCSFIAEIWSRNDAKSTTACVNSSLQAPKLITSLEFLPDEILVEIIDYLNQFDVLALCLANSRFHSLCMNKLFKRVLFINPQWHQILHCRKLNTLTNTNYTILNKFEGIPWDKFKFCMGEEFDTDIYQEGHDYYVRIDDYKEPIHPTDQFNQISYQLLWISLRDISQAYIDRIKNTKIIGLFKKVACSLVDTTVEILDQLQGTFVKVKSLIVFIDDFVTKPIINSFLKIISCENIEELELKTTFVNQNITLSLMKYMPNIKTLVIRIDDMSEQISETLKSQNFPLRRFSLDILNENALSSCKANCNLVKDLFKNCGSTLEIVKINNFSSENEISGLYLMDLYYTEVKEPMKEAEGNIRDLVTWIEDNIGHFPKLRCFSFYGFHYIYDKNEEPQGCQIGWNVE